MNAREKAEEFFQIIVQRRNTLVEIPLNCSQGETGALLYLTFVKNGITASELSEVLNVSLPRIASVINSLESKKLIEKMNAKDDKRKTIIYITPNGKELVVNKKEEAISKMEKIIERLDEEDIEMYIRLAKKIGKIMEEID